MTAAPDPCHHYGDTQAQGVVWVFVLFGGLMLSCLFIYGLFASRNPQAGEEAMAILANAGTLVSSAVGHISSASRSPV